MRRGVNDLLTWKLWQQKMVSWFVIECVIHLHPVLWSICDVLTCKYPVPIWRILQYVRFSRFVHLTSGRSTLRWAILQVNCGRNLSKDHLCPGQKNMQHSQTHFFAEKMCIFHARHCFLYHISVFDRVNLTQKRTGDHSHIFLSRLRMHRNNLEATENQKEVWAQSWTTWSIFTALDKISRTQGSRDIWPRRTVYILCSSAGA